MADFINTIDVLGDDVVMDSIIDRTITEFKDDKITKLGTNAFSGCSQLTTVHLPNVATMYASTSSGAQFSNCSSLVDINLPSVDMLGLKCFAGCSSLPKIVLPNIINRIYANAFNGCTNLRFVDIHKTCAIYGGSHFTNCKNLMALILRGDGLVTLGGSNCFTNTPIESGTGYIYIPGNLVNSYCNATNWSTYANQFRGIIDDEDALQGIIDETLVNYSNNTITEIPYRAFYEYQALKSIDLPNVTNLGRGAFHQCAALETVSLPALETGDQDCFHGTAIVEISLPKANNLSVSFFNNCKSLVRASLPVLTNTIGTMIFNECSSLTDVHVPMLEKVSVLMFNGCSSLEHIDLPCVSQIASKGFLRCTNLKSICLRSSTMCSLDNVDAFKDSSISANTGYIYTPRNLVDSYKSDAVWSAYASQFRSLEDYTVDGTTTGELDESKI